VFTAMIGTHYKWLLILAVLTSAVGVYYYLKVVIAMYFKGNESDNEKLIVEKSQAIVIVLSTIITLVIGIVPNLVADIFSF
jgi:NADH-quinone oxidoreductase subunit N